MIYLWENPPNNKCSAVINEFMDPIPPPPPRSRLLFVACQCQNANLLHIELTTVSFGDIITVWQRRWLLLFFFFQFFHIVLHSAHKWLMGNSLSCVYPRAFTRQRYGCSRENLSETDKIKNIDFQLAKSFNYFNYLGLFTFIVPEVNLRNEMKIHLFEKRIRIVEKPVFLPSKLFQQLKLWF